jgi:anaerobic ribonucleoside-triphosphate reductase activating protein
MTSVVFEEIPDKITLGVNISNCQNHCKGCHSPFLAKNIGDELTYDVIDKLIKDNYGINCFLFLGEGNDKQLLYDYSNYIKEKYHIDMAVYSGRDTVEQEMFEIFDYVKVGAYKEEFGPLNKETTNQRLYYHKNDITNKFWNKLK